jgi:amino acid permease
MSREGALKVVLVSVGLIFLFAVYTLMMYLWPSGWRWQPNQPEYEQMILGVYATLGIFLLLASRNPSEHSSLIAFTAWSSLVHAAIMAVPFEMRANTDICWVTYLRSPSSVSRSSCSRQQSNRRSPDRAGSDQAIY